MSEFCEGCPRNEIFKSVQDALQDQDLVIKNLGKSSAELLDRVKSQGPSELPIVEGQPETLTSCCKQPETRLVEDTLIRFRHSIAKRK